MGVKHKNQKIMVTIVKTAQLSKITRRLKRKPRLIVRKQPRYDRERERKAPTTGMKLVAADQKNIMFVPLATPVL